MLKSTISYALVILALTATDTFAQQRSRRHRSGKADQAVSEGVESGKRMRVIVRYKDGTDDALKTRVAKRGGRLNRHMGGALAAEMNAADVDSVLNDPNVLGVSTDAPVAASQTLSSFDYEPSMETPYSSYSGFDNQGLRKTLGLKRSDVGYQVGVAIIDSGISPIDDLAPRIQAFYDFTNGGVAVRTSPRDEYGHGTHIAGLIAGSGVRSNGKYVGTATSARLIGLKVLDANGGGYTSDVIAAVDFATANKTALGIDVLNMSLGHPIYEPSATDPLVQAVERAVRAGIVVVVSAGNHGTNPTTGEIGYAGITSPGNAPSALTVGSMRHRATASRLDDEVSPFSSRGPTWYDGLVKPDVVAPGHNIVAVAAKIERHVLGPQAAFIAQLGDSCEERSRVALLRIEQPAVEQVQLASAGSGLRNRRRAVRKCGGVEAVRNRDEALARIVRVTLCI